MTPIINCLKRFLQTVVYGLVCLKLLMVLLSLSPEQVVLPCLISRLLTHLLKVRKAIKVTVVLRAFRDQWVHKARKARKARKVNKVHRVKQVLQI